MKAIVAMSLNRVIGDNGKIPWDIKEDMAFFKKMTSSRDTGGYLIMGNKTFEQVGTLHGRFTYVFTNDINKRIQPATDHYRYVNYQDMVKVTKPFDKMWVCGGSQIYKLLIPHCDEVYATIVLDDYEGDTILEPFEHFFPNSSIVTEAKNYWIVRYWK